MKKDLHIIKLIREDLDISEAELAYKMNTTKQAISDFEKNTNPRRDVLDKYLEALGISFDCYLEILNMMLQKK